MKKSIVCAVLASIAALLMSACVSTDFAKLDDFENLTEYELQGIPKEVFLAEGKEPQEIAYSDFKHFWFSEPSSIYNGQFMRKPIIREKKYEAFSDLETIQAIAKQWAINNRVPYYSLYIYDWKFEKVQSGMFNISVFDDHQEIRLFALFPLTDEEAAEYRLGIVSDDLTTQLREQYKQNQGAFISRTLDNSPVFYANLHTNDIIVKINDTPIYNKADFLKAQAALQSGTTATITYVRYEIEQTASIQVP